MNTRVMIGSTRESSKGLKVQCVYGVYEHIVSRVVSSVSSLGVAVQPTH